MTTLRNKLIGMTVAAHSQRGASAVEYGLIVGLIAVAIVITVGLIGGDLDTLFQKVSTELSSAAS